MVWEIFRFSTNKHAKRLSHLPKKLTEEKYARIGSEHLKGSNRRNNNDDYDISNVD